MASSVLGKALVFAAVLALALTLAAAYHVEDEWESDTGDSEDGFPSRRSESQSSCGQWDSAAEESDFYDNAKLDVGVYSARRQLPKVDPGGKPGGANHAKCLEYCSKVPEKERPCCPLWCKYSAEQAKKLKGQPGYVKAKEFGWKSIVFGPTPGNSNRGYHWFLRGADCKKHMDSLWGPNKAPSGKNLPGGLKLGKHRGENPTPGGNPTTGTGNKLNQPKPKRPHWFKDPKPPSTPHPGATLSKSKRTSDVRT